MQAKFAVLSCLTFFTLGCSTTSVPPERSEQVAAPPREINEARAAYEAPSPERIREAWREAGTPSEMHKKLQPIVGNWNVEVKQWISPEAQPSVSKGTISNRWILGGRFIEERFEGKIGKEKCEGLGLVGYDNIQNRYVSTWSDSMSTSLLASSGEVDATGKTFSFLGSYLDPLTREKREARSRMSILSDNEYLFEMFDRDPRGREYRNLEITYTRK